ncbi:phage major tail tube protein [Salmonella enterica subsp. enterica serovar Napoli]|uniref:Phage major tail tube protein n=1 Tax=Salmonella enterica TaxID=28901 RepID=A0A743SRT1_SALER|nr:phage major tail tube protein [Salmonella enterica subsp. enterica serovar Napoli]HAF2130173.1 phage major tail tube protein [Salmonella enterica]
MSKKNASNIISGANIYLDGKNFIGKAEEVKLPDIATVVQEHKALGRIGKVELPYGFDKMEGEIKWNGLYPEAAKMVANPFKVYQLQLRASVVRYSGTSRQSEVPLVVTLNVNFKKSPLGTFKHLEAPDLNSEYGCTYVKMMFDGEEILELDVINNIFRVDGQDMLADYNANIGG